MPVASRRNPGAERSDSPARSWARACWRLHIGFGGLFWRGGQEEEEEEGKKYGCGGWCLFWGTAGVNFLSGGWCVCVFEDLDKYGIWGKSIHRFCDGNYLGGEDL